MSTPPNASAYVLTGRLVRTGSALRVLAPSEAPSPARTARFPARVAQMLALAHRLEAMITRGEFADRAALAVRLGLTRARITQVLALTLLAPEIQEELLALEVPAGRQPITERMLRPLTLEPAWASQRALWRALKAAARADAPSRG